MAKETGKNNEVRQLDFFDILEEKFSRKPDEAVKLPISPEDVGGELLAVLSKGLYTNPLDSIREYVQNAVDARAKSVTIKITGNSVVIFDDGRGMDLQELVQARQFGLSHKTRLDYVGFRGIGIYSGFDLCRRLRIASKKAGDPNVHVLIFEFAAMKLELEKGAANISGHPRPSLFGLLSEHTYIKRELTSFPEDAYFTQVELQDISDTHIKQISNRSEMRNYLLQNLPIDFNKDFKYRDVLNRQLTTHIPGYHPISITLQSDGVEDEVVAKANLQALQDPTYGFIGTPSNPQIAYYWSCLNDGRRRVHSQDGNERPEGHPSYEGFVYKVKGFTIGDRQRLTSKFVRNQVYPWYTGEIYVIDPDVIPNAARDDFETNQAKRQLEFAVGEQLKVLESEAIDYQERGVAHDKIEEAQRQLDDIEKQFAENLIADDFAAYSQLDQIKNAIKKQRSKAGEKKGQVDDQIKLIDRLQNRLKKEVDTPTPPATRRKRAAKNEQHQMANPTVEPLPQPPTKTLPDIFRDAGWEFEGDYLAIIELLQASLEDILTTDSISYRNLMQNIEERLLAISLER